MSEPTADFRPNASFVAPLNRCGRGMLSLLTILGAARSAAAAVQNGFRPAAEDLRTLGIEPKAFARIRLG